MKMRIAASCLILLGAASTTRAAFVPQCSNAALSRTRTVAVGGYLDDLSKNMPQDEEEDPDADSYERTVMKKEQQDRFGPGNWDQFVDFNEFDGGDGQMGVAGDGSKGLEKIGSDVTPSLAKSKMMSAKNAWGSSTGYADQLMSQNPTMDVARAQQLENWHNQQEVLRQAKAMKEMTETFDQVAYQEDENWRMLSKFGVQRNQDFDLNEAFGAVQAGPAIEGEIVITSRINQNSACEIQVKNDYMGFADFRASFTPETSSEWSVDPREGSLTNREPTTFIIKFRPNNPGTTEGYLVIETEDMKKTWKLIGSTG